MRFLSKVLRDIGDIDEMFRHASLSTSSLGIIDFVGIVHETLDKAGIRFAISGAFALAAHGVVRQTSDLDIVLLASDLSKTAKTLKDAGFQDGGFDEYQKGRVRIHKFKLEDREVDILDYPKNRDFLTFLFDTAKDHELIPGKRFTFIGVEGIIVTKLIPFRRKDQMDIDNLKKKKEIDLEVVKTWCVAFGMIDRYQFMELDPID